VTIGKIRLTATTEKELRRLMHIEQSYHGENIRFSEPSKGKREWLVYGEIAYPDASHVDTEKRKS
jgi:hypothetical protein